MTRLLTGLAPLFIISLYVGRLAKDITNFDTYLIEKVYMLKLQSFNCQFVISKGSSRVLPIKNFKGLQFNFAAVHWVYISYMKLRVNLYEFNINETYVGDIACLSEVLSRCSSKAYVPTQCSYWSKIAQMGTLPIGVKCLGEFLGQARNSICYFFIEKSCF